MKLQSTLLGICAFALYAVGAPHTWILNTGDKIKGEYLSSTKKKVFIVNNGTNCAVKITDLSTNDLAYIAETQFARRRVTAG